MRLEESYAMNLWLKQERSEEEVATVSDITNSRRLCVAEYGKKFEGSTN